MPVSTVISIDEVAKLMTDAAGAAQGLKREVEGVMKAQGERVLANMDLVRRDEFEAVKAMAAKAREENESLAARVTERVRARTRLPVIPKLSPNVTDIGAIARRVESAGADAISLINTIPAMAIDVETRRPRLANVVGGLSGPAIRPIAVRLVYQAAQAVRIPIIGIGGIGSADDALEFIIAGAAAVQIGTMNFVDPGVWSRALAGLVDYCRRHDVETIGELSGSLVVDTPRGD